VRVRKLNKEQWLNERQKKDSVVMKEFYEKINGENKKKEKNLKENTKKKLTLRIMIKMIAIIKI